MRGIRQGRPQANNPIKNRRPRGRKISATGPKNLARPRRSRNLHERAAVVLATEKLGRLKGPGQGLLEQVIMRWRGRGGIKHKMTLAQTGPRPGDRDPYERPLTRRRRWGRGNIQESLTMEGKKSCIEDV